MARLILASALAVGLGVPAIARATPRPVAAPAQTVGEPVKIMPLGDSITYGVGAYPVDSYRSELFDRLTRAGLGVDFVGSQRSGTGADVDNEGHPGWTVWQLCEHIRTWLATYQPDVILLHVGTNDMRSATSARYASAKLSMLLNQIAAAAPSTQVFVARITGAGTPRNRPLWKGRIDRYNAQVPAIVAAKGRNFHLVDQSSVSGIDLSDIVHPNAFGFSKMAWNWYRALEPVLRTGPTRWPTTDNPYLLTSARRCIAVSSGLIGRYALGCHLWYLRPAVGGTARRVWQIPVDVVRWVHVRVTVRVKTRVKIDGTWVTTYVTRHVTRNVRRSVTKWITGY